MNTSLFSILLMIVLFFNLAVHHASALLQISGSETIPTENTRFVQFPALNGFASFISIRSDFIYHLQDLDFYGKSEESPYQKVMATIDALQQKGLDPDTPYFQTRFDDNLSWVEISFIQFAISGYLNIYQKFLFNNNPKFRPLKDDLQRTLKYLFERMYRTDPRRRIRTSDKFLAYNCHEAMQSKEKMKDIDFNEPEFNKIDIHNICNINFRNTKEDFKNIRCDKRHQEYRAFLIEAGMEELKENTGCETLPPQSSLHTLLELNDKSELCRQVASSRVKDALLNPTLTVTLFAEGSSEKNEHECYYKSGMWSYLNDEYNEFTPGSYIQMQLGNDPDLITWYAEDLKKVVQSWRQSQYNSHNMILR